MVKSTEYYDILEVSSTCTETELKKSYRRLCLIHHPDKQTSMPASGSSTPVDSSKFQSIQNAYETLSDPDRRENYDRFGSDEGNSRRGGGAGGGGGMDEMFASMFGGQRPSASGGGGRGGTQGQGKKVQTKPSVVSLKVSLEELYNGKEKKMDVERTRTCNGCSGTGAKPKTKPRPCNACEGKGLVRAIRQMGPFQQQVVVECPDCAGLGTKIRAQDACKKCKGIRTVKEKSRIEFFIERGMVSGSKIVLAGQGDESPDSSSPGDLYIILNLSPHSTFTLLPSPSLAQPSHLCTSLSLTLSESILGFNRLILIHLDGRGIKVHQPSPGEKGWRVLRGGDVLMVKGEGMWKGGRKGDLKLIVSVEMPEKDWALGLGKGEINMLTKLLPPKKPNLPNPTETDEVELEPFRNLVLPTAATLSDEANDRAGGEKDYDEDDDDEYDEDDEEGDGQGCQQQ